MARMARTAHHGSQGQVEKLHLAASGRAPQVSVRIGASGTLGPLVVAGPSESENHRNPRLERLIIIFLKLP
jgi:hypothetical protein